MIAAAQARQSLEHLGLAEAAAMLDFGLEAAARSSPRVWPASSRAEQLLPAQRGLSRRPSHEPEAAARSDGR
jgi:hypothetical protein